MNREDAIEAITGTGKSREQADAFLDILGSAFRRRGWVEGEPLTTGEIDDRMNVFVSDAIPSGEVFVVSEHTGSNKVSYSGAKLVNVGDARPPEYCATCGHQVLTLRCGIGRDSQGRPLCHPNEPGHPDCYTLATRTFGRVPP